MEQSREALETVIELGEEENGNIEFKKSLSKDIHLADNKRTSLVAQLRHRVLSGEGKATYVVGVDDSGEIEGLEPDRFEETLDVLSLVSEEAGAHISEVQTFPVEKDQFDEKHLVGLVSVEEGEQVEVDTNHLVVGTAGHVDHGKSSLVASLVTGDSDNGEGGLRSYLDVQPHEVQRGLSADLSYAVYGFTENDEPIRLNNPDRNDERSKVVKESDRLVSFVDTVGHKPWLHTTIRGLVGQRLDYGLLTVAANEGPTDTTREHLGVLLAMNLPLVVTITKTDMVEDEQIEQVESEIEEILRHSGCNSISASEYGMSRVVDEIEERVVPIVRTSAVSREGLDKLDKLFAELPKRRNEEHNEDFQMYIDKTYVVEGVGTVVSGSIMSGQVSVGDEINLGPDSRGEYIETKARSIQIHYHSVEEAEAGQPVSIALKNVEEHEVQRGMVLSETKEQPVREFEADVVVLNHPTSIRDGYEPVIHLETISETVTVEPEDGPLLPGDNGKLTIRFKFNPYHIREGQRFIFREGDAKGVGTVTSVGEQP